MEETNICPVCDTKSAVAFTELLNLPIYCNLLWQERDEAIACPKGDIRLAFCHTCGAITNTAFDPSKLGYSQDYENSLHYSARFQAYAQALAERLVKKHQLHGKTIIEIGCGKGDFLVSLCELGENKGIGFDSSYAVRDEHEEMGDRIQFIQDFYSEKYAHYLADFVCCRQVLEHVKRPDELLIPVGKAVASRSETTLFFEVPNGFYTFGNMMIWDIIYEHCTYFTPVSLTYAFTATGYNTSEVSEEFGGQFLSIEANLSFERFNECSGAKSLVETKSEAKALAELATTIKGFESRFKTQKQQWEASLKLLLEQSKKIIIWGSGSKGVTFLNLLGLVSTGKGGIEYAVDINPRKQGKFIPGTGQEIVAPERMKDYEPDVVIVMNPLYQQEIKDSLSQMNLAPQIVTTESFVV